MTLTPGKMRGLQTTSNNRSVFSILAVDHGASLAGTLRPDNPNEVTAEEMVRFKSELLSSLAPFTSAVLVDPVYSLAPAVLGGALPGDTGLIISIEDGDYAMVQKEARLLKTWSVGSAKRAGANAVKCFFYYHPDDKAVAKHQERFVQEVAEACQKHDVALFAEPLSYGVTPATRQHVVVETARRISRLGIDVLKIEFPIDVDAEADQSAWLSACLALTDACQTPWVLLSAGVDFEVFARQVDIACRSNASGYMGGRAIWREGARLSGNDRLMFWQRTAVPRLKILGEIAASEAKPWTDFYPYLGEMPAADWYQSIETSQP